MFWRHGKWDGYLFCVGWWCAMLSFSYVLTPPSFFLYGQNALPLQGAVPYLRASYVFHLAGAIII